MLWTIRQRNLERWAMLSIAIVVLNMLTLRYLATDDIENTNLAILSGKCIALDPGHGGIDSGTSANGVVEKEINMAIAQKLADILIANGANVVLTRDKDTDYYTRGKGGKRNDLLKRIELIENSGAALFVSIHVNAIKGDNSKGAQVFYSPKLPQNKLLAETMQQALKNFPPGNKRQAKQDLGILVLNANNIPGVLVETGYATNPQEANLLADGAYQQKLAEHMAKALAYHFSKNGEN